MLPRDQSIQQEDKDDDQHNTSQRKDKLTNEEQ